MTELPQDPFLPDDDAAGFGKGISNLYSSLVLGGMPPGVATEIIAKYMAEMISKAAAPLPGGES